MPYLGKQPANVPVTADDIPNDSITSAKILDNVITISDIGPNAVGNSEMADDAVGLNELSATGTTNSSTFLRGDNTWATAGSTSASDLTSGTLPIARIADDAITADKLANSINSAIAANTSKTGITSSQASAITANTAKTGITSSQTSAITANTAKTGITSSQTSAITANTAKTGITSSQATAITAALPKTGSAMTGDLTINDASNTPTVHFNESDGTQKMKIGFGTYTTDEADWRVIADKPIKFSNNNTERMRIAAGGNVGIGVTDPDMKLEVNGQIKIDSSVSGDNIMAVINSASDGYGPYFKAGGGNTSQFIFKLLNYSGSEKFRVDGDGKVGIGTTAPARTLHVSDTTSGATTGIRLTGANNGSQVIEFADTDDTNVGYIQYDHGTNRISIRAGDANKLNIDGDGLKFGTDTAAANALDDYEEGTWTPTISTTSGGSNMAYQNTTGHYRKIGGLVHVFGIVQLTAKNNLQAGSVFVQGFPFTMANPSGEGQGGNITEYGNFSVNFNSPCLSFYQAGRMFLRYTPADGSSTYTNVVGGNVNDNTYFRFNATYTT